MRLYIYLLTLFWSSKASRMHKFKALLWGVYYHRWIRKLHAHLSATGTDYVLQIHPYIPFMFRMKAYILKQVNADFILSRLVGHYQHLDRCFGEQGISAIHTGGLPLKEFYVGKHKINIVLQYIDWMSQEGQLSVKLLLDDQVFYYAQIHFYDRALWIGGFQGCPNQLEVYKRFTKDFMGLRPHNFMYLILTVLAKHLALEKIYAVAGNQHYYQKKERTMRQVQFGYDEFWSELGGELMQDGAWFSMPIIYPRKKIAEIPSKKRSQYNQRYALIDQVMAEFLGQEG
ncbi:MAG: DUF535 family protein [Pseudomonadota bacterium]|nr:DUF535 family protein [Pseudomonadota bacterium]